MALSGSALAFAVTGGAWCSVAATAAIHATPPTADTCLDYWFDRYQSLIGAAAALVAAVVGFIAVRSQVNVQLNIERSRAQREESSSRAVLSITLARIVDYCNQCARQLNELAFDERYSHISLTPFPVDTISSLQENIRWATGPEAYNLKKLIATIQVFVSRYNTDKNNSNRGANQCMLDLCVMMIEAERLFAYTRTTSLTPDATKLEIQHAVRELNFTVELHTELDYYLSNRPADEPGEDDDEDVIL